MRFAYDDAGSGDCVVLIHGHPFDRTLGEPQLAALRGDFRVLAPDLRGFGESLVTPHLVRMRQYATHSDACSHLPCTMSWPRWGPNSLLPWPMSTGRRSPPG